MTTSPLNIGVLGCANIARQFIRGARPSNQVRVRAVASRSAENAAAFAAENQVEAHHGSYEALLADPSIEAIYLPLPNSLHAQWAIAAAEAGKHILCEKPLAMTLAETEAMFEAARRHDVVLLESYPYWFQPQMAALLDLLNGDAIGEVRTIQACFGFKLATPEGNIRTSPELGGGALLDAGSYVVSLIRLVMGDRPLRVHALATEAYGVDMSTLATLEFSDGRRAQLACAMDVANNRFATIIGSRGVIQTEFLNHTGTPDTPPPEGFLPSLMRVRRGTANTVPFEVVESPVGSGFRFAAEAFASLVRERNREAEGLAAQASMDIAATLEAIQRSIATGGAVEVVPAAVG